MFEKPPTVHGIIPEWLRRVAVSVGQVMDGKTNNVGTVTLTASATTTTIADKRIGIDTGIYLSPTTANAATALSTTYHSATTAGSSLVLTHANNAEVDRTFNYILVG